MLSAYAVVSRNAQLMEQTTTFQAVVAPGLALCGLLLYGSNASIATGGHLQRIHTVVESLGQLSHCGMYPALPYPLWGNPSAASPLSP